MTEEQKLNVHKFRIDIKEHDVNKCREVFPVILYFGYYCYANLKKIKWNCCKNWISGIDHVEEIIEINNYFQGINRGSLFLYTNDTMTNRLSFSSFSKSKEINHAYNIEYFARLWASF